MDGTWIDGAPPKHIGKTWFIAETTYGERCVLRLLPEEYTYDYTTADGTYLKVKSIKKWMQFPDSEYRSEAANEIERLNAENARLREALEDIASGRYSGVLLTSFPPKDPAVERARAALAEKEEK